MLAFKVMKLWNELIVDQVIVVDDGSSDGTKRVAFDFVRKYKVDNVRVVLLGKNQGKGEAIRKVSLIHMMIQFPFYINMIWFDPCQLMKACCLCESIVKQGMLHSRGKLLLMLDADGATKVDDMEKLEKQVGVLHNHI